MIYSRRYARLFITMQQESKQLCINSRPCMGRGLIEIKNNRGKIALNIQGVKPNKIYKALLIGDDDAVVSMGNVNIDNMGKGEFKWQFDPDNIENNKIENFNAIAVVVDENNELIVPMVGYMEKIVNYKSVLANSKANVNKKIEKNVDKLIGNENIESVNGITVDNSVDNVDNNKSVNISENVDLKTVVKEFKKNMLELEHYTFLKKEEIEGVCAESDKVLSDIEIILNRQPADIHISIDGKLVTWYKILPEELGILDENLYPLSASLFLNSCYKKNKNLLYGIYNENGWEKQVIAIPCESEKYSTEAERFGCREYNNGFWIYRL